MDPKLLQQMQQMQGGQGQQGGMPQLDPNFNPDSNPFESFMAQLQGGQGGGGQVQGPQMPQEEAPQMPMDPAMMKQMGMPEQEDQTQKGAGVGATKFLLGAAQQLQGYIAESTERDEIAIARSILQLLTRLIDKDQTSQFEKLEGGVPAPQPGGMPQPGAGQGAAGY